MKLKTLKDLEFGRTEKEDRTILRQEAIKHIKALEKEVKGWDEWDYGVCPPREQIEWIKHFFNITEEDLK